MANEKKLKPAFNIGPGYTIKKYLDDRGWSQEDLSELMDISAKQLSQIINNKVRITIDTAVLLGKVFETSAESWINKDTEYRLNLKEDSSMESETQIKAQIRKFMPVSEILKKGWYNFDNSVKGYESLYEAIWGKEYTDDSMYKELNRKFCARQKKDNEKFTHDYSLTWQQVARLKAKEIAVPSYNEKKLQDIIHSYTTYTYLNNGISKIVKDLNNAGIKFFILSHLSKTYLDGACFYDKNNPVVVYTARYDRVDNFWFTLAHELAHVIMHLPKLKDQIFLDDLKDGEIINEQERDADKKAEEILRTDEILQEANPYLKYFSEEKLDLIAKKLKIEHSVIVGVLQHKKLVDYRKLNKYKKKVLEQFPQNIILG